MYGTLQDSNSWSFELLNKYHEDAQNNWDLAKRTQEKMKQLKKKIDEVKKKIDKETAESYELLTLESEYALAKKQFATYLTLSLK